MAGTLSFDDIKPEAGDYANSYEQFLQVYTGANTDLEGGTEAAEKWITIPEITALNPNFSETIKDISNYAYKGTPGHNKTGDAVTVGFQVYAKINPVTGDYYDHVLFLLSHAKAFGEAQKGYIRWGSTLGASDAFRAKVLINHPTRQNTGDDDPEVFEFSLQSDGAPVSIDNPFPKTAIPQG